MGQSETETDATHQSLALAPLRVTQRMFGHGLAAALTMQYAIGYGALEMTRITTRQQLEWLAATTSTDQQATRHAVETGFDAIETGVEDSEQVATDTFESTFDTFLATSAPFGQPPAQRPERRSTA